MKQGGGCSSKVILMGQAYVLCRLFMELEHLYSVLQNEKAFFNERQQKRHHRSRHNSDPLLKHQVKDSGAHNNIQAKIRSQQAGVSVTNLSNMQNSETFPLLYQES